MLAKINIGTVVMLVDLMYTRDFIKNVIIFGVNNNKK